MDVVLQVEVPTGLVATATSTTSVGLSWTAVDGSTGYRVYRKDAGSGHTLVGSPVGATYTDGTVSAETAYLYKVRAWDGANESPDSNVDLATTVIFTDPVITPGATKVKTSHITELRTAVYAVRALAGLGAATYADASLTTGFPIKAAHVTELRTALDAARTTLDLSAISYTDPTITPGTTAIKAAHITDLRTGVQ